MNKPNGISDKVWEMAEEAYEGLPHWDDDATIADWVKVIALAISKAIEDEREAWMPAIIYFDRYCQDEADDVENCVCGRQQHEDAKEFQATRNRSKGQEQ